MWRMLAAAVLLMALPVQLSAQQDRPSGTPRVFGDAFTMLSNPQVQKELELMEGQRNELRDLQAEYASLLSEQVLLLGKPGASKQQVDALREQIQAARQAQLVKIEQILLSHQLDRLNQISLQMKMIALGDVQTLTDPEVAQVLGIGTAQKAQLRKRAAEIESRMVDEIAQLKRRAREELLGELTAQQRREFEKMLGSQFDQGTVEIPRPSQRDK